MNKKKLKNTSEEMLLKIIQYIDVCDIPTIEKDEIVLEMACTLLSLTLDFDDNIIDIAKDIKQKCNIISELTLTGIAKYKAGNKDDVRYEFLQGEEHENQ